jgi:hypothetical protein
MRSGSFQNLEYFKYLIWLSYFNDPKKIIVNGRWTYEVDGKRNSTFGLEMR